MWSKFQIPVFTHLQTTRIYLSFRIYMNCIQMHLFLTLWMGVYQIPSWVYASITEIYMNIILDRALTPEHQMSIPISREKVSYIRGQNCGQHWMIIWRFQKLSRRSKHVWSLSALATTSMNMNIKFWMWEYLAVAKGQDIWSRNHKTRTCDGRWDIPLQ